jgi:phosphotransferase system enzyme I (PtsI)
MPSSDSPVRTPEPLEPRDVRVDGIGVSSGASVGRVLRLDQRDIASGLPADVDADDPAEEIERLKLAVSRARKQVLALKERVATELGRGHAYFFEAHLLMLDDSELLADVERVIRTRRVKAEWAVKAVLDRMLVVYAAVKDDYLRERGSDIEDVARRVIRALAGRPATSGLARLQHDVVVVANTLPPSTAAELDLGHVLGFATGDGGFTSHTAIIARSLGIPAVVGLSDVALRVTSGEALVVDGSDGCVIVRPSKPVIRRYLRQHGLQRRLAEMDDPPARARTTDGHLCILRANVELTAELDLVRRHGARGIGLYRSEFLFLNSLPALPSEDEQTRVFEQVADAAGKHGATIRTFDLGGDKLPLGRYESEQNPALGQRALRLALGSPDVFRTHVRAILRASARGSVRILFPMVAHVEEMRSARAVVASCMAELDAEGVPFDRRIAVGAMIEVPSAVLVADQLASECDFFSIGTNDLIQYLLAVDRSNQHVAPMFAPLHPSVLRALRRVIEASDAAGIPSIVCGEMASDPVHVAMLVGLGYDRLSMTPTSIPLIKRVISAIDRGQAVELAGEALACRTAGDVDELMARELPKRFPGFFRG